jgi:uncharacterized protein (DUF169 family)
LRWRQEESREKGRKYADFFRVVCENMLGKRVFHTSGPLPAAGEACALYAILQILWTIGRNFMGDVSNWSELEKKIASAVKFSRRPVAVTFFEFVPAGIEKFSGTEPSGCSFWRLAAAGRSFYTLPENHFNCAVGAYTHNIPLPAERQSETEQTLKMMFDLGYVKPEEIPQIPRLPKTPEAILYSPLGDSAGMPDVVLFSCRPAAAMLLSEAAGRAEVASGMPALGRPTCMALPAALQHGSILSLGCMGNRVYTELGEDEMYVVVRGRDVAAIADALGVITSANAALDEYAKGRRQQLAKA